MTLYRDLSFNGAGVNLGSQHKSDAINLASDTTLGDVSYIRVGGAGNLVIRAPGSSTDITIAATAGEYVPVDPGTIVRSSGGGTTATGLHTFKD